MQMIMVMVMVMMMMMTMMGWDDGDDDNGDDDHDDHDTALFLSLSNSALDKKNKQEMYDNQSRETDFELGTLYMDTYPY